MRTAFLNLKNKTFWINSDNTVANTEVLMPYSGQIAEGGPVMSFNSDIVTNIPLQVDINPVQSGSGDPSPSNVRPISGWDEVTASVAGKNLCPSGQPNEMIEVNLLKGWGVFASAKESTRIFLYDKNQNQIDFWAIQEPYENGARYYRNFFVADGTKYVKFEGSSEYQIEFAVQNPTPYTPYQGQSYPIPLPSTVYGGELDVTSGEGKSTMGMVDLGSLTWGYETSYTVKYFWAVMPNDVVGNTSVGGEGICSHYARYDGSDGNFWQRMPDKSFIYSASGISSQKRVYIRDDAYTDATAFKTAMNGAQLCYKLATPTDIATTPTPIPTLLGNNNIWADSGDVHSYFSGKVKFKYGGV